MIATSKSLSSSSDEDDDSSSLPLLLFFVLFLLEDFVLVCLARLLFLLVDPRFAGIEGSCRSTTLVSEAFSWGVRFARSKRIGDCIRI